MMPLLEFPTTTSARPPVFANGTHSEAANTIFINQSPLPNIPGPSKRQVYTLTSLSITPITYEELVFYVCCPVNLRPKSWRAFERSRGPPHHRPLPSHEKRHQASSRPRPLRPLRSYLTSASRTRAHAPPPPP